MGSNRARIALITGVTGQDGAILARFLLEKNYRVHGLREYSAVPDDGRLEDLEDIILHYGDMTDSGSLQRVLRAVRPDEIYNLAAMSHVHVSFMMPEHTMQVNSIGVLKLLEAIQICGLQKTVRLYQASSSEMFGSSPAPQNETTPFSPCSPYGNSKLSAYWSVCMARRAYGLFACNGILFNHESPLRGEEFVTRKVTKAIGEIEAGICDRLTLGNLDARRDWGHARDYMEGAWMMLQQDRPDDYVLASGEAHSVREFVEAAFACIGISLRWTGKGLQEKGYDARTGQLRVDIDPVLFRPTEINELLGDASKARRQLGWQPKNSFENLVREMVEADRIVKPAKRAHVA